MVDLVGPGAILPRSAAVHGEKVALVTATRTLTYAELAAESGRVAASLVERGVRPGETVSIYAQNSWQWVVSYHGALRAGAVVNPVNVMLTPAELAFVLADDVPAEKLDRAIRQGAAPLLVDLHLFDVYRGVGDGRRSLAFRLRLQAADRSLTDADIAEVREKVIAATSKLGA